MRRGWVRATVVLAVVLLAVYGTSAVAALCVWLNPDRDIRNFFPGADSYTTDLRTYSAEQQKVIEKRIGGKLDPDENEFKFYRVKKSGKIVGTVLTHQARGRYGAVQTVAGIGPDHKVIGVYVQRHREPVNLNTPSFLKQFKGKAADDPITVGKDIAPIKGAEQSSQAVAFSVKKIMVVFDVLGKK